MDAAWQPDAANQCEGTSGMTMLVEQEMRDQSAGHTTLDSSALAEQERPEIRQLEGKRQLSALLRGNLRMLPPLLGKLRDVVAARFYLRASTYMGRYVRVVGRPFIHNGGTLIVGDRTIIQSKIVRTELIAYAGGRLEIGPRTWIHYGCSIAAHELIRIGADCQLGPYTNIIDNAYHEIEDHLKTPPSRPVIIGDNVWIGTRVIILPGVTIGDRAVIGAGAVVTKDVPPRSVAAGNPARILRTF